ncbi:MAG: hypothetical protein ABLQ96_01205 [Candidatus Acidiferrum sp.]
MLILLLLLTTVPFQQSPAPDPGVVSRGDHAMGFSHETTVHHFRLYKSGGAIEVLANDPADSRSRDEIRMHLSHIAKLFSAGDFNVPMFIHDTTPPGAPTMTRLRAQIHYRLQPTPRGAKIIISTKNSEAITAIHDFLRFQITDHKTADSPEVH